VEECRVVASTAILLLRVESRSLGKSLKPSKKGEIKDMKRTIKKQFWFNREEAQDLQKKAKKTCLTEAALVRLLIRGYEPKEKPDERFYDFTRELSRVGNSLNQLAAKANSLGYIDTPMLEAELKKLHKFQADIEDEFLNHDRGR